MIRRQYDQINKNNTNDYGTMIISYLNITFIGMSDAEINKVMNFIQNYRKLLGENNYGKLKNN